MSIVFKAPARLDAEEIKKIRPEFDRLVASGRDVVVDFSRTESIDGSGVGAIVFTFKRLSANGKRLTIRNISGQPLELLNAADLLRTLNREPAGGIVSDALRRFGWRKPMYQAPASARPAAATSDAVHAMPDIEREKGAA